VRREVAGEQHDVDPPGQGGEDLRRALAVPVAAEMDVAGGGDPDPALLAIARGTVRRVYRHT
jgi:hypothetical protein